MLDIHRLHYNDGSEDTTELVKERFCTIKQLYYDWCTLYSIKPNQNEGWFKSKKFTNYRNKIGWGGNYALFLDNIIKYEEPKNIFNFTDLNGTILKRPPQNMFNCLLKEN